MDNALGKVLTRFSIFLSIVGFFGGLFATGYDGSNVAMMFYIWFVTFVSVLSFLALAEMIKLLDDILCAIKFNK